MVHCLEPAKSVKFTYDEQVLADNREAQFRENDKDFPPCGGTNP